jgi:hypothetical protein
MQTKRFKYQKKPPMTASEINFRNNTYIHYLSDEISYYYYVDINKQTLILERFEYWKAPWWNFFVQTNHYLVEKFTINGDTLTNQETDRFTRFGKQYILDKALTNNHFTIKNPYIR